MEMQGMFVVSLGCYQINVSMFMLITFKVLQVLKVVTQKP